MSYITLPKAPSIICVESLGCALPDLGLSDFAKNVSYADLLHTIRTGQIPQTVIAWLICSKYDALDLAAGLGALGFSGRLVAVSPVALPRKQMVLDELRAACPQISYEIWERQEHAQLLVWDYKVCSNTIKAV